jgi:hypothetical protein
MEKQIVFNRPFGTHPIPDWGYIPVFGVLAAASYLLLGSRLYTEISSEKILFQKSTSAAPWHSPARYSRPAPHRQAVHSLFPMW